MNDINLSSHHVAMRARQADMSAEAARNQLIHKSHLSQSQSSVSRTLRLVWTLAHHKDNPGQLHAAWTHTQTVQ